MVRALDLFLQFEFLQLALLAGILVAVLASVLGVPLVLREMSMFGHGFAHVAYAGVAIGFLAGIYPLGVALLVAVGAAVTLQVLWSRRLLRGDAALAIVVSVGFAVGVVVVSLAGGFTTDLASYLFGSLFAVTPRDVAVMVPVTALMLLLFTVLYKEMFYVAFDEEGARLSGVPVDALNVLYIGLTAATIVLASRVVGLLLVASLLVIPASTALQVARSFRSALIVSLAAGVTSVVVGMMAAAQWGLATGGSVVLAAAAIFVIVALGARVRSRS